MIKEQIKKETELDDFSFSYEDLTLTKDIERAKRINKDGDFTKGLMEKFATMTKEEQQNLIMKYIEYIEVEKDKEDVYIKHIEFRNTFIDELANLFEEKAVEITLNLTNEDLKTGDNVIHDKFGEGVVVNIDGSIATIAFRHGVGIRSLASNHKSLKKICK